VYTKTFVFDTEKEVLSWEMDC